MIAACAMLALSLAGLRAQSNEEYNFTQQGVVDGSCFNPITDDVPILSMDCLAANGYGQWSLSTKTGIGPGGGTTNFTPGWYLHENALRKPSAQHIPSVTPSCIPPGVVQNGSLTLTWSEPRVVTNLDGTTIYIWPDSIDRSKFIVQYFNNTNINIAIASGFPNSLHSRQVVKTGPQTPPPLFPVNTSDGTNYHDVVDDETDFRDRCDFKADAAFLYIAWCSTVHCPGTDTREVWVTAYNLQTWAVPSGYPVHLGQGWRPRLACDPRDNRNTSSPTPQFDIAFLTDQLGYEFGSVSWYTYNGTTPTTHALTPNFIDPYGGDLISIYYWSHICPLVSSVYGNPAAHHALYALVSNSEYSAINELVLYNDDNPKILLDEAAYVDGPLWQAPIGSPIEDAIGRDVVDHWIEAFANPYDNGDNAGDHFPNWREYDQFHCLYQMEVELIDDGPEHFPLLIVRGSDIGVGSGGVVHPEPIDPARDIDGDPYDTRLVINQDSSGVLESDPDENLGVDNWYVAAVNQMGIHVHWHSDGQHFYSRDMGPTIYDGHISRAFDAPIDEKTLVTGTCDVTDGRVHGGTQGATIVTPPGFGALNLMTVWTDPNYGPPSLDGSVGLFTPQPDGLTYLNPYVGALNFIGDNVVLNVGDDILHSDYDFGYYTGASLAVFPYFYFNFPGTGQGVTINYASYFDYWGLNATHHSALAPPIAIATPFTDGTADGYGAGTIDLEGGTLHGYQFGTLTVHGGSDFYIGAGGNLVSNIGLIDVLHENSVYPVTSSTPLLATGHMTLWGTTTIGYSGVSGNAPAATSTDEGLDLIITSYGQFTASNSEFNNNTSTGLSNIQFGDPTNAFKWTTINTCIIDAAQFHAYPRCPSGLTIENSEFSDIRNYAIEAEQNTYDPQYAVRDTIIITGNNFYNFQTSANMIINDNSPYLYGIWVRNFSAPPNSVTYCGGDLSEYAPINIDGNQFVNTGNYHNAVINNGSDGHGDPTLDFDQSFGPLNPPVPTSAAILLENTTAYVTSNVIEDNGYSVGIGAMATLPKSPFSTPKTYSLICSNTISGLTSGSDIGDYEEVGMFVTDLAGYIQNNTITGCDNGFSSGGDIKVTTHFVSNTLTGNLHTTLEANDAATLDMSGIHGMSSGYPDLPGLNTISGPSTYVNTLDDPANEFNEKRLIHITYNGTLDVATINLSNSNETWQWTAYGQNNIILTPDSAGNHPLIENTPSTIFAPILSVDSNYFEVAGTPVDPSDELNLCPGEIPACGGACYNLGAYDWTGGGSVVNAYGITYCALPHCTFGPNSLQSWSSGCQDWVSILGTNAAPKKGAKPQSLEDSNSDTCAYLYNEGELLAQFYYWQESYDTLKLAIERCPNFDWPDQASAFGGLDGDVANLGNGNYSYDSTVYASYRVWLYSVLYLNTTDPGYFCFCVQQIFNCFAYIKDFSSDSESFVSANMEVAFDRWLIQNSSCDSADAWANWQIRRNQQRQLWLQDSMDGLHYPYDTTIPTLSQIGYGIDTLLAKHQLAEVRDPAVPSIILSATASPNPVSTGTIITFGISQEAYVKINLFDILGHGIEGSGGEGFEGLFEPGNHEVPLSLQGLPSGTYFARILTAYGNVATVKLVKE